MANPSDISRTVSSHSPKHRQKTITFSTRTIEVVIVVILLCGVSFFFGRAYQKHYSPTTTTAATSSTSGGTSGSYGFRGGEQRAGGFGQVTAVSSASITIQNPRSGTSTTYSITSSTTITDNGQTVTVSDIQTGDTVFIRTSGTGSTTALTILVNPSFGGAGGGTPTSNTGSSTNSGSSTSL